VLAYALLRVSEGFVQGFRRRADAAVPQRCALAAPLAQMLQGAIRLCNAPRSRPRATSLLVMQLRAQAEELEALVGDQPRPQRSGTAALLVGLGCFDLNGWRARIRLRPALMPLPKQQSSTTPTAKPRASIRDSPIRQRRPPWRIAMARGCVTPWGATTPLLAP
jgi:hypothetical protein